MARAVFLLLALSALNAGDPCAGAPVRIAYSSISGAMLPLWVAKDKNFFAKHGVDVEVMYIRGVAIEALLAGELQFVRASPPSVVRSTIRGADLAIIANTVNVAVFSLMTGPEIKRPEDLKGKRIGVTNLGDSPDLVLSLLLERWSLQRNRDVTVLAIRGGMPELMVAVAKGFVDGGMISAPNNLRGMKIGLRELVDAADYGIRYVNSPLSTRRSFIRSNRDTVLRVLRAYQESVQDIRNDRTGALKVLAKYVRVDDPAILNEVYRIYGDRHLPKSIAVDLEGVKGLLKGLGSEAAGANPASFVDPSLVQELEKDGSVQRGR
jgi:ABC-type nitrate/sulfonate/bicarbonate transport system substrate-binding protein